MTLDTTTAVDPVRAHLALALDVPDLEQAVRLAEEVAPWFGVAKVGLELYSAAGAEAITRMRALDLAVFADLKFHDIPTTVERAARVIGEHGVTYLNFHAAGGVDMLRAGVEGLRAGAAAGGHAVPRSIAVTVLTSDADTSSFDARLQAAMAAGCEGVVCSAHEVERVHEQRPDFVTIVPGVRFSDGEHDDQARVATPQLATIVGADVLVMGRAVTASSDPRAAAERTYREVAQALAARRPAS